MTRRISVTLTGTILVSACALLAQSQTVSFPFAIPSGGIASLVSASSLGSLNVGFAKVLLNGGNAVPEGLEILQFRQNNVLISETTIPESQLVSSDQFFVEVNGNINTGLAIANPNGQPATISFGFQDPEIRVRGALVNEGTLTIPPNSQISRFINEAPFNSPAPYFGMMTIISNIPVAITSLRGLTNERSEFLITPVLTGHPRPGAFGSVVSQPSVIAGYIPLFAAGDGWSTEVVVINLNHSDSAAGTFDFLGADGKPVIVTVDGTRTSSLGFNLDRADLHRFIISDNGSDLRAGYVRITASAHSARFDSFALLSFRRGGTTVAMTSLPMTQPTAASSIYVEESGDFPGQVKTGIAISNDSSLPANVTLHLTDLSGQSTGLTSSVQVPPFGQISKFLKELPGFSSVPFPFRGTLEITTSAPTGVAVVGTRGHTNERSDFLFGTVLPTVEPGPAETSSARVFPQVAQGGGYNTDFVLLNRIVGQSSSGSVVPVSQSGVTFNFESNPSR